MTFEVVNPAGRGVMVTHYKSCIPYDTMDCMAKAGYRFKVDDRFVAKNKVKDAVENSTWVDSEASQESVETVPQYSKKVRCIDTGKVYDNQASAARDLGIDPAQVSDSIKTGRPRSGYTFERVAL